MKRLAVYLKDYKKECLLGPVFKFIEVIFELLLPTVLTVMINRGVAAHDRAFVLKTGLLMAGMAVLGYGSALICQKFAARASQGFGTALRGAVFEKVMGFSCRQLDGFGASTLTTRLTNDVSQLQVLVAMMIRLFVRAPFICIGAIAMSFFLDTRLALLLLAATPVLALVIWLLTKSAAPLYARYQRLLDRLTGTLRESLSGVRVVRAFGKEADERARFGGANDELTAVGRRIGDLSALFNPLTSLVINLTVAAILWVGGGQINAGRLEQGTIIAFVNYVTQILYALAVISNLIILVTKSGAAAERVCQVLYAPDEAPSAPLPPLADAPRIAFRDVTFSYPGGGRALDGVTLDAGRGETLGIIGVTGCGKSTLAALLAGFYAPDSGGVFLDGTDVRAVPEAELRRRVAVVQQKAVLFSGTAAENIAFGRPDAAMDEIRSAARAAQAEEFIEALPKGYETRIERGGANLSGGQKQRLAIARALLMRPDVLVLDDASSALDYLTESKLRAAVRARSSDMTVLVVSQRVGVIRGADRIAVMDGGRIVGAGTHRALMDSCPEYRELCLSQLTGEEAAS